MSVVFYNRQLADNTRQDFGSFEVTAGTSIRQLSDTHCFKRNDNHSCEKVNDNIDSYDVKEEGLVVSLFEKPDFVEPPLDKTIAKGPKDLTNSKAHNKISSLRVLKDCDNKRWAWDPDCEVIDPNKVVSTCSDTNTKCYRNRMEVCNQQDLASGTPCLKFCLANQNLCPDALDKYCEKKFNPLESMANDPDCGPRLESIRNKACKRVGGLESQTCRDFCKSNIHTLSCMDSIKSYCVGEKIATDSFCNAVLANKVTWGKHDNEMIRFCQGPGKGMAICNCVNPVKMSNDFEKVHSSIRDTLLKRPECYYKSCVDSTAYRTDPMLIACNTEFLCDNVYPQNIPAVATNHIKMSTSCLDDVPENEKTDASGTKMDPLEKLMRIKNMQIASSSAPPSSSNTESNTDTQKAGNGANAQTSDDDEEEDNSGMMAAIMGSVGLIVCLILCCMCVALGFVFIIMMKSSGSNL